MISRVVVALKTKSFVILTSLKQKTQKMAKLLKKIAKNV